MPHAPKGYRIVAALIPIDDDQPAETQPFGRQWRKMMFVENHIEEREMLRGGMNLVEKECTKLGKKLASSVRKVGGALPW